MSHNSLSGEEDIEQTVNLWVARYEDGRRKDHLIVGDTDELEEHAPAIAHGKSSNVEHLGTFAEFANNRHSLTLDLPKTTAIAGHITGTIGRERFWSVLRGDNE